MRFVNTITWNLINCEKIIKITWNGDNLNPTVDAYLTNGEEHELYETGPFCMIEGGIRYVFNSEAMNALTKILVTRIAIHDYNAQPIFDMTENEDSVWEEFIVWAMSHENELQKLGD